MHLGKVTILEDKDDPSYLSMGYIQKGKPYLIPHLLIDTNTGATEFGFDKNLITDHQAAITNLKGKLVCAKELKVRYDIDNRLPKEVIAVGVQQGIESNYDAFLFKHEKNTIEGSVDYLQTLGAGINPTMNGPKERKNHVVVRQKAVWSEEHYRLYGKMIFNLLAQIKGKEFVLNDCFDGVRNWIAYGGENLFASFDPGEFNYGAELGFKLPVDVHVIYIIQNDTSLYGLCCLYNSNMFIRVTLTNSFAQRFIPEGLICDWNNKREYRLQEYILQFAQQLVKGVSN